MNELIALFLYAVTLVAPASSSSLSEPYGGCDEAWQAPRSAGAGWCLINGRN